MRKRRAWRYYCEFCRKAGCSGGHIARHEQSCTANPNRVCQMHRHCDRPQKPIGELIAILTGHRSDKQWDVAISELREAACGCPACMLAAIRQSGLEGGYSDEDGYDPGPDMKFDFDAEKAAFWSVVNDHSVVM